MADTELTPGSGVEDITHLLDDELGSAYDQETLLFQGYEDGGVFNYDLGDINEKNDMLEVDGKAETLVQALTLPVMNARFSIQRDDSEREVHEFISDFFAAPANNGGMRTPIRTVISQILMSCVYRKSYHEKVWTMSDDFGPRSRAVYKKLAWRPPTTCAIVRDKSTGAFAGFRQMPIRYEDQEEIYIKPHRALVHIHNQHRNPLEGKSDLDIAHWCYITKQKIRFLWYQFLEGQSLPKTVVKARTEIEANKAASKIVTLRSGGVVGVTDAISVSPLESSGKGASQFKEALQWLDGEASGSVLAGFTDLGAAAVSGTGSFALSKSGIDFFSLGRQANAQEVADTLIQYMIADLVFWNFGAKAKSPRFEFAPIAEDDAAVAISLLTSLAVTPSPVVPKGFTDELVERVAGLLGLNTQIVRQSIVEAGKQTGNAMVAQALPGQEPIAQQVGTMNGQVERAASMVQGFNHRQAGGGNGGLQRGVSRIGA
jgi:hypothetical protein